MKQEYKGYIVVIEWGAGFKIMKLFKGWNFVLLSKNFHFTNQDEALQRACEFIDSHPDKLVEIFKPLFIDLCNKIHADPKNYLGKFDIDVKYYLKAYKKLNDGKNHN